MTWFFAGGIPPWAVALGICLIIAAAIAGVSLGLRLGYDRGYDTAEEDRAQDEAEAHAEVMARRTHPVYRQRPPEVHHDNAPCHPECFGPRCRCHGKTDDYLAYHRGERDVHELSPGAFLEVAPAWESDEEWMARNFAADHAFTDQHRPEWPARSLGGKIHDIHGFLGEDCWCGYVGRDYELPAETDEEFSARLARTADEIIAWAQQAPDRGYAAGELRDRQ